MNNLKSVVCLFAMGTAWCLSAAVSLTEYAQVTRSTGFPKSSSGITYAGGNTYYVVADDASNSEVGLYRVELTPADDGSSISSVSVGSRVSLTMATDLEAVAYDPTSGHIWAANETTSKTINEYDPADGSIVSSLSIPSVMLKDRGNLGFESLTISGDGLTLWTANEESLSVDGPRSAYGVASTNRLVKFTREAPGRPWQLVAMYPYVTDSWHELYRLGDKGRRGISDLCALPDGSLLVLERELSTNREGEGISALASADFYIAIYRITPQAMAAATDVKNMEALANGGWTAVAKGSSLVATSTRYYNNWEGLCLGQRLSNGTCFVPMLTDAGDGYTSASLMPLVLSGLDIRSVDFPAPAAAGYSPSVVGSNYRYLKGTPLSVTLTGEGLTPVAYTNRGSRVAAASWSSAKSSGTGPTASFVVNEDDRLVWTVATSIADTPIIATDTFEDFAVGTAAEQIAGWTEAGTVVAETYAMPEVGAPMQRTTHTKVLSVDDSTSRSYTSQDGVRQQLDLMVRVVRPVNDKTLSLNGHQSCVWIATDGRIHVVHAAADGSQTDSVASEKTYANGDWVRVTMAFDYTASVPEFALRIDGAYCGKYRTLGSCRKLSGFDITGETAVDDVIFTDGEPAFEVAASSSSTVPKGVTVSQTWLDRYGLAWNDTESDADGDGLKVWEEYLSGTSPVDASSAFAIAKFEVKDNLVAITFTGDLPRPDLLKLWWCETLGGETHEVAGEVTKEGDVSVWQAAVPAAAKFFRATMCE